MTLLKEMWIDLKGNTFSNVCPLSLMSRNKPSIKKFTLWFPKAVSKKYKCVNAILIPLLGKVSDATIYGYTDITVFTNTNLLGIKKYVVDPVIFNNHK